MFEDYRHDPGAKRTEEELNKPRPLMERFGTNPKILEYLRKQREKGKAKE